MESVFDSGEFNESLFVRRQQGSPCPSEAEDFHLPVAPGITLHARAYWAPEARATFIVFHGNGEIIADYDALAPRYRDEVRANLIVVDYRGYGLSSGTPTFRTCIEDTFPALSALKALAGVRLVEPCIALGRSLGGACAAELAGIDLAPVQAVVLESAPADWRGIVRRRNLEPPRLLTPEEAAVFDPAPKLERCRIPALVLHGDEDVTIRPHEARTNFSRLHHAASRLVFIPRRNHGDVLYDAHYYQTLCEFIEVLKGPNLESHTKGRPQHRAPSSAPSSRTWTAVGFFDELERHAQELDYSAGPLGSGKVLRRLSQPSARLIRRLGRVARRLFPNH